MVSVRKSAGKLAPTLVRKLVQRTASRLLKLGCTLVRYESRTSILSLAVRGFVRCQSEYLRFDEGVC